VGRVIRIYQDGSGQHRAGPPLRDDRFVPLIEMIRSWQALNQPYLAPLRFTPTKDACRDLIRSLYLAARYYCSCGERYCTRKHNNLKGCPDGGQRISCQASIVKDSQGRHRVQFSYFDKKESIRAVVAKYGPDPSQWPYNSRAKKAE